ncbi:hypothetical protein AGMMS50256_11590 [Betaproteobacteria bacterium]|nr:hypothetical protein AGMMS50256_11590 [Betaproteobacteria bacterium]
MIDNRTPKLHLPLPHPANALEEDVLRLRAAFGALDTKIAALEELTASEDLDLDTLSEIVEAVKAAATDISAINAVIETEVNTQLTSVVEKLDLTADKLNALIPLIYAGL